MKVSAYHSWGDYSMSLDIEYQSESDDDKKEAERFWAFALGHAKQEMSNLKDNDKAR